MIILDLLKIIVIFEKSSVYSAKCETKTRDENARRKRDTKTRDVNARRESRALALSGRVFRFMITTISYYLLRIVLLHVFDMFNLKVRGPLINKLLNRKMLRFYGTFSRTYPSGRKDGKTQNKTVIENCDLYIHTI